MDEHFRAFTFVDCITLLRPGVGIHGRYSIPAGLRDFPASLVAESIGQLAAWAAMAAVDFRSRPVAGLAASVELFAPARPGQELDLAVELDTVDEDAVAYSGTASVGGTVYVRLRDCVGPMVPLVEFDDPQALRDQFARLSGAGATPGGFGGLPAFSFQRDGGEVGRSARAVLRVPTSAPFFADHFPRRPVFPGSLLMHLNLELAAALSAEVAVPKPGAHWKLQSVTDVKLRAFIAPGETLGLEARLMDGSPDSAGVIVETRRGGAKIGSVRLHFVLEELL